MLYSVLVYTLNVTGARTNIATVVTLRLQTVAFAKSGLGLGYQYQSTLFCSNSFPKSCSIELQCLTLSTIDHNGELLLYADDYKAVIKPLRHGNHSN